MKIDQLREMNKEELGRKLTSLEDELFKLNVKVQTKQVENTAQLGQKRKAIARIKTVLREMDIKGVVTTAAAEEKK